MFERTMDCMPKCPYRMQAACFQHPDSQEAAPLADISKIASSLLADGTISSIKIRRQDIITAFGLEEALQEAAKPAAGPPGGSRAAGSRAGGGSSKKRR